MEIVREARRKREEIERLSRSKNAKIGEDELLVGVGVGEGEQKEKEQE